MSNPDWPLVPLGEVLTRNEKLVTLLPDQQYREVTIRLWGKGVVLRQIVNGADIASQRRSQVFQDQFIVSRIDARNGAMGLVPPELDGAVVTNDFPSFNVNRNRLLPAFLGWLCRTESFVDTCRSASEGTTNRVRLKEERFLKHEIPLPPLKEQQRIVERIDSLVSKVAEAYSLRQRANQEYQNLCRSILRDTRFGEIVPTPLAELVTLRKPDTQVNPSETYQFAGVYCFGRGVFSGQKRSGMDFAYKQLTRVRAGEFIYPKLMAWEGALGIVPSEFDGHFVSPEFPVFSINEERVLPEVLDVYFRSPSVWPSLGGASTGTNVRSRRLNPNDFLRYSFPLPTRPSQMALRAVRRQQNELESLQNQSPIFDAMLPSILDRAFKGAL
jgi:type I restriction enzyme, S subunit